MSSLASTEAKKTLRSMLTAVMLPSLAAKFTLNGTVNKPGLRNYQFYKVITSKHNTTHSFLRRYESTFSKGFHQRK